MKSRCGACHPTHSFCLGLTAVGLQERLYVVHVAAKDIPTDSGLKPALVGPENTIIISNERGDSFRSQEVLDLVTSIDLFEDFPINRSREILQKGRYEDAQCPIAAVLSI